MNTRTAWIAVPFVLAAACADQEPPHVTPPAAPEESPPPTAPPSADPVAQARSQAPITGGLLLALRHSEGNWVAAADPDTDRIFVVDLDARQILRTVQLGAHDAPRRMVQLPDGRVAVALARDAIVLFDPTGDAIERVATCALPRGIDYDAAGDRLLVTCREGHLVAVPAHGDGVARSVALPRDVRDVVVAGDRIYVTRFKAAEVLLLDADLRPVRTFSLSDRPPLRAGDEAAVTYRAVAASDGSLYVLHQLARTHLGDTTAIGAEVSDPGAISVDVGDTSTGGGESDTGGDDGSGSGAVANGLSGATTTTNDHGKPPIYYSRDAAAVDCSRAVVAPTISVITVDGQVIATPGIARGTLMVDLAVHDGRVVVADAGSRYQSRGAPVRAFSTWLLEVGGDDCDGTMMGEPTSADDPLSRNGPVTSVAFDRGGATVALMTAPLIVMRGAERIVLGKTGPNVNGYRLFHGDAGHSIACGSCHPEGEDDGLVWHFVRERRTPALGGGLLKTAPFHWSGDLRDIDALLAEVFTRRMGGKALTAVESAGFAAWMETIPATDAPPAIDVAAASRGAATFLQRCAGCHLTPPTGLLDVGTGEPLQTPLLRGMMFRAPYLHDGCATTLTDRFGRCATPRHGAPVPEAEVGDLVQYLETL